MIDDDDRSFRFGDGLFETVRVEKTGPLGLELHLERFERSARALGFPFHSLREGLVEIDRLKDAAPGIWRVTVSRDDPDAPFGGSGTIEVSSRPFPEISRPSICLLEGFFCPDFELAEHKTTSWIRSVQGRRLARERGVDDAIFVSGDGLVGEATSSNLFVVVNDEIVTPPARGILRGTARRRILDRAEREQVPVSVRPLSVDELHAADEIVLTNAATLAVSAKSLDGRKLDADCSEQFRLWLRE
jgi:branched-subunit amino acid aminotransferase/4-amino-4-deoxychorismate lyase